MYITTKSGLGISFLWVHAFALVEKSMPAVLLVLDHVSCFSASVFNHTDGLLMIMSTLRSVFYETYDS